ncbi:MAG: yliI [Fibrobacteres bacterium]|nr:yliI [Fibrobacterota bacterium]
MSAILRAPSILLAAITAFAGLAAFTATTAHGQIGFKDAFPGLVFDRVTRIAEVPGMPDKTFLVLEQHVAQISLVTRKNGAWVKSVFFGPVAVNQQNEMGFLGLAVHPDFRNNRKYYLSWNPVAKYSDIIDERQADATFTKDAGTVRNILTIKDPEWNHNGGTLHFGKDGFLYAGFGDGGGGDNQFGNGQNKGSLLAKILRLDVDHPADGRNYGIPADNPFVGQAGFAPEIWAWGFRNPWKWSFDPLNQDMWVGDVGQNATEEVDIVEKGQNYGWPNMEGPNNYKGANDGTMKLPVYSYGRALGSCVIGGVVYRGNPASKYYGTYFAADLSGHQLFGLKKNGTGPAARTDLGAIPGGNPITFDPDAEGNIYMGVEKLAPIYMLDSPDLKPAPVSNLSGASGHQGYRLVQGGQGGKAALPPGDGSGKADRLGIFNLSGKRIGYLAAEDLRFPEGIRTGLYILKPLEAAPEDRPEGGR